MTTQMADILLSTQGVMENNPVLPELLDKPAELAVQTVNRYNEGIYVDRLGRYINSTYGAHYAIDPDEIQCFDAMIALGSALTTFRDITLKYLWRVGRKGTKEKFKEDLYKAMHYIILMLYLLDKE
jgi:hypothetical protein